MGLSNNDKYKATQHFKQRLFERYGVETTNWKPFMRTIYSTLHRDVEKTESHHEFLRKTLPNGQRAQIENTEIWHSDEHHCYVVVDKKNFKLITIFEDPDYTEQEILSTIQSENNMKLKDQVGVPVIDEPEYEEFKGDLNIETPYDVFPDEPEYEYEMVNTTPETSEHNDESDNTEDPYVVELSDFAAELDRERDLLVRKTRYRFAQKVMQLNAETFENFIKAYERVITGNATQTNMDKMDELYQLKQQLDQIFPQMKIYK